MPGITEVAAKNLDTLHKNPYPGRGIIQGLSSIGDFAQVYWVMGRSFNSRNRVLHQSSPDTIATAPFDPLKVEDPSLIIYNAMRTVRVDSGEYHVVSNGDHTDKVVDALESNILPPGPSVLLTSLYNEVQEPDEPNSTPRITGLYTPNEGIFQFHKISRDKLDESEELDGPVHTLYDYQENKPGFGFVIHTYNGDGNPLPTFDREPYLVPLNGNVDEIAETYWDVLNPDNRVGLAVKTINYGTKTINVRIINALGDS